MKNFLLLFDCGAVGIKLAAARSEWRIWEGFGFTSAAIAETMLAFMNDIVTKALRVSSYRIPVENTVSSSPKLKLVLVSRNSFDPVKVVSALKLY